jgi:hypothetical protein
MGMGHQWNDTDNRIQKYSEKKLFQDSFIYHKFHFDKCGNKPGFLL